MSATVSFTLLLKDRVSKALSSIERRFSSTNNKIKEAGTGLDAFTKKAINTNQIMQTVQGVSNAVRDIANTATELTNIYAVQSQAETKLQTVMKQRMNATEAMVSHVKKLAAEQQKLGVIGDEVQLSGTQQLATFLNNAKSIDVLLPAMNDLVAQQKGVNATSQDAVNIANMMGKAMMGEATTLRRVGITFTEAEGNVLKYGNEQERASMLAQVITNNVGHMNAAIAATDIGKAKQTSNAYGDIKEKIGKVVASFQPMFSIGSEALATTAQVGQIAIAMQAIGIKTVFVKTATLAAKVATSAWTAVQWLLNAAMSANPVGLVVVAIAALVAGIIIAWNKSEKFRAVIIKSWEALKKFAVIIKDEVLARIKALLAGIGKIGTALLYLIKGDFKEAFSSAKAGLADIGKAYNPIRSAVEKDTSALKKEALAAIDVTKQIKRKNPFDVSLGYTKKNEYENDPLIKNMQGKGSSAPKVVAPDLSELKKQLQKAQGELEKIPINETVKINLKKDEIRALQKKVEEAKKKLSIDAVVSPDSLTGMQDALDKKKEELEHTPVSETAKIDLKKGEIKALQKKIKEAKKKLSIDAVVSPDSLTGMQETIDKKKEELEKTPVTNTVEFKAKQDEIKRLEADLKNKKIELGVEVASPSPGSITALENKLQELENIRITISPELVTDDLKKQIEELKKKIKGLKQELGIDDIEVKKTPYEEYQKNLQEITKKNESSIESFNAIGSTLNSIGEVVGSTAKKWVQYGGNVLSAIGQAIPAILTMMSLKTADTAVTNTNTTAKVANASSEVMAAHASIPFVGIALGLAGVASIVAAMMSLPKFANGGIAYGPTLGLFGEYAGAQNNPEVVAPLNKLRSLLNVSGNGSGTVVFEIAGRNLRGVLNNFDNYNNRI